MASELVRRLVDAGIHFGHRSSRWNPKMAPYIFGKRNTIHIIDIRETVKGLLRAKKFIAQLVASGKDVLFVGTKRQARPHIKQQSGRVNMPYVAERWLGGTLTNFRTIRLRLGRMEELEAAEADGTAQQYSKKMMASRSRELQKIRRNLEGIREMTKLPGALIVIDVHREKNAVREARILKIPTICLIDTDSDPDFADIPIPGNDDAMRAIDLILSQLADAVELGLRGRKVEVAPPEGEVEAQPQERPPQPTTARADDQKAEVAQAASLDASAAGSLQEGEPPKDASAGLTPATASESETSA